jgi:hypothetical protein
MTSGRGLPQFRWILDCVWIKIELRQQMAQCRNRA